MASTTVKIPNLGASLDDVGTALGTTSSPTLIPEYMTATTVTGSPAAGKFHSEIQGRAPMLDLAKYPTGRFGVERIPTGTLSSVSGESGPLGQTVYRQGDSRIRYYGSAFNTSDQNGFYVTLQADAVIEVTFYGTGLNVLLWYSNVSRTALASVDGGAEGSNIVNGTSTVLNGRNYSINVPQNAVSGLPLGIHTVKIRSSGSTNVVHGFEILNEATTVAIPAGSIVDNGRKYTTTATTDDLTTFQNKYQDGVASGSSTKGGHQVRYFDNDGTIKKDINYADSTTLTFPSTDHSNEEVVQRLNWSRFGAGRPDDFSNQVNNTSRAFTLDDGTTTLVGANVYWTGGYIYNGTGGFLTLTWVGTGLDILRRDDGGGSQTNTFSIDGAAPINLSSGGNTDERIQAVVSGLPFGTHTAKFTNASSAYNFRIGDFIIYAPKKPVLADGQVEIDSTYKMADFVVNTTQSDSSVAQGVITKSGNRELVYGGTFSSENISPDYAGSGWRVVLDAAAYVETTFFGTGYGMRQADGAPGSYQVSVGGQNFTTANFGAVATNAEANDFGGMVFTASTGILATGSGLGPNGGWSFNGLPLDTLSVRLTTISGGEQFTSVHIVTPTYSYKNNILNTSGDLVGSNSLKNEILVPGATKNKIIATEGIDLGPNKIKWQLKTLSANHTTTGNIDDLRFSGLTLGRTYKVQVTVFWVNTNNDFELAINIQNGTTILKTLFQRDAVDTNHRSSTSGTVIFNASSTEVSFVAVGSWGATNFIALNNTWSILEELPNHIETTEW